MTFYSLHLYRQSTFYWWIQTGLFLALTIVQKPSYLDKYGDFVRKHDWKVY